MNPRGAATLQEAPSSTELRPRLRGPGRATRRGQAMGCSVITAWRMALKGSLKGWGFSTLRSHFSEWRKAFLLDNQWRCWWKFLGCFFDHVFHEWSNAYPSLFPDSWWCIKCECLTTRGLKIDRSSILSINSYETVIITLPETNIAPENWWLKVVLGSVIHEFKM